MAVVTIATDFTGKVAESLTENPHILKYTGENLFTTGADYPSTSLRLPNEIQETDQASYDLIAIQDNSGVYSLVTGGNGISQVICSFDVIKAIEKTYGQTLWRGKTALVDKIEIVKNIVTDFTVTTIGATSVEKVEGGYSNKRFLSALTTENIWDAPVISEAESYGLAGSVSTKTISIENYIDAEGYIHFTTYGENNMVEGAYDNLLVDYAGLDITLDDSLTPEPEPTPEPTPEPEQQYVEKNIFLPAQYFGSDGSITEEGRKMLVDKHSLSGKRVSITSQPPIVSIRTYH